MEYDTPNALADRGLDDLPGRFMPLSEHDEFEIADGYPEVRGWDVRDSSDRSIGYVYDLLVDVLAMRVQYLDVLLDPEFAGSDGDQRVLLPIENVALDRSTDRALLPGLDAADVRALAPYAHRRLLREREVAETHVSAYAEPLFERRPEAPLTLSEEEVAIDKSLVDAGAVSIQKTVETERVSKKVPVLREEVDVERRPLAPGEVISAVETRGDEIRIPIMAEEVVVEKRLVAKEVLIVRKRRVTEERTIETDVRREQVHVNDPLGRVRTSEGTGRPEERR